MLVEWIKEWINEIIIAENIKLAHNSDVQNNIIFFGNNKSYFALATPFLLEVEQNPYTAN